MFVHKCCERMMFSLVLWCTCQGLCVSSKPGSSRSDPVSTQPFKKAHFSGESAAADGRSDPGQISPALHRSPHHHQGQVWRRSVKFYFWMNYPFWLPTISCKSVRSVMQVKQKACVRVCEMWTASCVDEVCEANTITERSFVMGWPTHNCVATFR